MSIGLIPKVESTFGSDALAKRSRGFRRNRPSLAGAAIDRLQETDVAQAFLARGLGLRIGHDASGEVVHLGRELAGLLDLHLLASLLGLQGQPVALVFRR